MRVLFPAPLGPSRPTVRPAAQVQIEAAQDFPMLAERDVEVFEFDMRGVAAGAHFRGHLVRAAFIIFNGAEVDCIASSEGMSMPKMVPFRADIDVGSGSAQKVTRPPLSPAFITNRATSSARASYPGCPEDRGSEKASGPGCGRRWRRNPRCDRAKAAPGTQETWAACSRSRDFESRERPVRD